MESLEKNSTENQNKKSLRVAIDFGGVITQKEERSTENKDSDHDTTQVNMPYVKESLLKLKTRHTLYLNSFCGFKRAVDTYEAVKTEIPDIFEKVYFVKDRKYKGLICKYEGCHVLIDDRLDVLQNAKSVFPELQCILFYTNQKLEGCEFPIVNDWRVMEDIIERLIEYKDLPTNDNKIEINKICHKVEK